MTAAESWEKKFFSKQLKFIKIYFWRREFHSLNISSSPRQWLIVFKFTKNFLFIFFFPPSNFLYNFDHFCNGIRLQSHERHSLIVLWELTSECNAIAKRGGQTTNENEMTKIGDENRKDFDCNKFKSWQKTRRKSRNLPEIQFSKMLVWQELIKVFSCIFSSRGFERNVFNLSLLIVEKVLFNFTILFVSFVVMLMLLLLSLVDLADFSRDLISSGYTNLCMSCISLTRTNIGKI